MGKKATARSARQALFVKEYLIDLNAAAACLRAGYCKDKPRNAHKYGSALLKNPEVADAIQKGMNDRADRVELKADDVLRGLFRIATADLSEAYDESGRLLPVKEIPKEVRQAIAGIKVYEEFLGRGNDRDKIGEVRELKFWDKTKALDLLGRHLKLFQGDQLNVNINNTQPKTDEELDQRIKELLKGQKK
jgi:phage terminase small subunit